MVEFYIINSKKFNTCKLALKTRKIKINHYTYKKINNNSYAYEIYTRKIRRHIVVIKKPVRYPDY